MSKSHGQRRRAGGGDQAVTAPSSCACGSAAEDYRDDMPLSEEILGAAGRGLPQSATPAATCSRTSTTSTRRRDAVADGELPELDRCALDRGAAARRARAARPTTPTSSTSSTTQLVHFCSVDLCAFYLDVLKDRLYCERAGRPGAARRADRAARGSSTASCGSWRRSCPSPPTRCGAACRRRRSRACSSPAFPSAAAWRDDALAGTLRAAARRARGGHQGDRGGPAGRDGEAGAEARIVLGADGDLAAAARARVWPTCRRSSSRPRSPWATAAPTARSCPACAWGRAGAGRKCERCWLMRPLATDDRHPTLCARCAAVVG